MSVGSRNLLCHQRIPEAYSKFELIPKTAIVTSESRVNEEQRSATFRGDFGALWWIFDAFRGRSDQRNQRSFVC